METNVDIVTPTGKGVKMTNMKSCVHLAFLAAAALAAPAVAQTTAIPLQKTIGQVTQTGPVASLFVLNSRGAKLEGGKLTMESVSPNSIAFADRPVRSAGHIETAQFIEKWKQGEDDANIDPPNATISVLGSDGSVADAVVTISAPVIEGDSLTFTAVVLEGRLDDASGPAALFIDRGGFGGFHGGGGGGLAEGDDLGGAQSHFSNYAHVQNPHAGWYGSNDGSNDRTVNYDPHNNYHNGGYNGGWGYPVGAGVAGFAAGAALGGFDGGYGGPYPNGYCGYAPYPPCN